MLPFRDPVFTRIFCTGLLAGLTLAVLAFTLLLRLLLERCGLA